MEHVRTLTSRVSGIRYQWDEDAIVLFHFRKIQEDSNDPSVKCSIVERIARD